MRIFSLVIIICLLSTPSWAQDRLLSAQGPGDYCGIIANDMKTTYVNIISHVRADHSSHGQSERSSITFQALAKSFDLAGCDAAIWRGKILEIEQELNSD